jgi:cytochrome c peroxidase
VHPGADGRRGTADDVRGSVGVLLADRSGAFRPDGMFFPRRQVTTRKTATTIMAAYAPELFWDGRAGGRFADPDTNEVVIPSGGALENLSLQPLLSHVEMAAAGRKLEDVTGKLARIRPLALAQNVPPEIRAVLQVFPDYHALFAAAFGTPGITARRIALALATYQRTLVSDQSPWDRHVSGRDQGALTANQLAGWELFRRSAAEGGAGCASCHVPPLFTDHSFRNTGVRPSSEDPGRAGVTGDPRDQGRFKVPTLRNVSFRAPFFHNGSRATLGEVVDFYDRGGDFAENRDPLLRPLGLTPVQKQYLQEFLYYGLADQRAAGLAPFDRIYPRFPTIAGPVFGSAAPGSGGLVPEFLAFAPPRTGHDLTIGVAAAPGGAPAVLAVSLSMAPLTYPPQPFPINVRLDQLVLLLQLPLAGAPESPGSGFASLTIPIPPLPALAGRALYAQWFVADPGGFRGISASKGAMLSIAP